MTPALVLALKKEAAALKVAERIKQTAALARIAQREGFSSWEALLASAGDPEAVREAKFEQPPTPAQVRRAERAASRMQRYGGRQ
jgi:hypothetical protein